MLCLFPAAAAGPALVAAAPLSLTPRRTHVAAVWRRRSCRLQQPSAVCEA